MTFAFQSYNNCGPQVLSSVLGYYGFRVDQAAIAAATKKNRDDYMTADMVDRYVSAYGLHATRFKRGDINHVRQLLANGVPVVVVQWLKPLSNVPHFRVVTGFDDQAREFHVLDPYYGPDLVLSYEAFTRLWQVYDSEFIPVYPANLETWVYKVLGVL